MVFSSLDTIVLLSLKSNHLTTQFACEPRVGSVSILQADVNY